MSYCCSVVGVLDDPTLEFQSSCFSFHTGSEPEFSQLIVEEDGNVEGEGWDGEVREWNLSGTKGNVKWWHVQQDGDEGSFEEKTEVSELVDHELLGEGQVSGLADHKISPLDAHNGYEVTRLSVFESLNRVANWPVVGKVRESVEVWETCFLRWIPSALCPLVWFSNGTIGVVSILIRVEKSDINFTVVGVVP